MKASERYCIVSVNSKIDGKEGVVVLSRPPYPTREDAASVVQLLKKSNSIGWYRELRIYPLNQEGRVLCEDDLVIV